MDNEQEIIALQKLENSIRRAYGKIYAYAPFALIFSIAVGSSLSPDNVQHIQRGIDRAKSSSIELRPLTSEEVFAYRV